MATTRPKRESTAPSPSANGATATDDDFGAKLRSLVTGRFFVESWRGFDEERDPADRGAMREAAITLVIAVVTLTLMEYAGETRALRALIAWYEGPSPAGLGLELTLRTSGYWDLATLVHWCLTRIVGFGLVPLIVVAVRRRTRDDLHLRAKGLGEHAWMYGLAFVVVLSGVIVVSRRPEFATYYPFDRQANRSWVELLSWEALYFLQFLALELFFRGFLLSGTKRAFGSGAIFVAMVPYVMIHFGKPMLETLGAIVAGLFLGTLAMKTRSIWLGFLLHIAIALSMDLAALVPSRGLPTTFYPTVLPW